MAQALPEATPDHAGISPGSFDFRHPPLFFDQPAGSIDLGPARTPADVQCVLHRFGGASFVYRIPLRGSLDDLLRLADALYDNGLLKADATRRAADLMTTLGPALSRAGLAPLNEDYAVYHLRSISPPLAPDRFLAQHALRIAQILRSEPRDLSAQEIADALDDRIALTPSDLTIVDWNSALILQPSPDPARAAEEVPTPADIRAVLEFANMSLLELRILDDRLDRTLDGPPASVFGRVRQGRFLLPPMRAELRRLAELQTDAAALFDSVSNSFKLVGDPYLARLFRLASHRLRLEEWDGSIRRRLATAESIYSRISDHQTNRRMEILEWIIILLIAFEILMAFVRD